MKTLLITFLVLVGCASTQRVEDLEAKLQTVQLEQARADHEIAKGLCGHDGLLCLVVVQDRDQCIAVANACEERVNDAYKHRVNRIKGTEPPLPEGSAARNVETSTVPQLSEPDTDEPSPSP